MAGSKTGETATDRLGQPLLEPVVCVGLGFHLAVSATPVELDGLAVRGVFIVGGRMWGSMDLIRGKGSQDYGPREVAFLKRMAPHLAVGLRAAALRARAPASGTASAVPGVLPLDPSGRVTQHTPAAERWLQELGELRAG